MANMRDVAKKAGVGIATVSRYINNDGYVSKEVGDRIQEVIDELGYKPNTLARAIFTKKSKMIGLIIPNILNPFFPELAEGIEKRAREEGYKIVLCSTKYDEKNEKDILEMLLCNRVDGIVVIDTRCPQEYTKVNIPIVSLENQISDEILYLTSDNFKGGTLVAEFIIKQNLRRILHVKGSDSSRSAMERYRGFKSKLSEKGFEFDVVELVNCEDELAIKQDLNQYDVIFAWNDDIAIRLISECYKKKLIIPDDIQIIGFDNIYYSRKISPSLTTVNQPICKLGEAAVDLIIKQIKKKHIPEKKHILDVKLIERETTKG
ncbi:LacI family DNA-binding transcriptional regulator [Natronincola ferrireducens]|uniref:Transcriptional regulator, LacI family n=1 Tax=Natronincola ferrireducens TaxID=393762 RepID=A0A1G9GHM9_9FIRM|nr:LacI family DNA-binding transcriptional regulator [Natronincola ferrireducens]SDL00191.1 transcriptional regulator, LacI family [Natronincola ferrireducens]